MLGLWASPRPPEAQEEGTDKLEFVPAPGMGLRCGPSPSCPKL